MLSGAVQAKQTFNPGWHLLPIVLLLAVLALLATTIPKVYADAITVTTTADRVDAGACGAITL